MGEALKRRIKQESDFAGPAQEAMLNLMVAADHFRSRLDRVCAEFGITHGQYNVLRILRGAHPEGHPRCDIAARMLEKAPDVTRLVDRLEAQGLAERARSETDRRLSITRITEKGLALLEEMRPAMEGVERYFAERVSRRDARELTRICEGLYGEEE
jgi:DNA-binding MarR family transcriptional regulator